MLLGVSPGLAHKSQSFVFPGDLGQSRQERAMMTRISSEHYD